MNNYHKHKGLSPKVQAIKRNEERAAAIHKQASNDSPVVEQSTSRTVRRVFTRAQGELIRLQDANPQTFDELFNFYRDEIYEIQNDVDSDNEAWGLLQELIDNKYFKDDKAVKSKEEFYERVDQLLLVISKYID